MKPMVTVAMIAALAGYGLGRYQTPSSPQVADVVDATAVENAQSLRSTAENPPDGNIACDGRQYCSQMTSCKEAIYFLRNCPDVKMDGGGDGVPCEKQWCGDH